MVGSGLYYWEIHKLFWLHYDIEECQIITLCWNKMLKIHDNIENVPF